MAKAPRSTTTAVLVASRSIQRRSMAHLSLADSFFPTESLVQPGAAVKGQERGGSSPSRNRSSAPEAFLGAGSLLLIVRASCPMDLGSIVRSLHYHDPRHS